MAWSNVKGEPHYKGKAIDDWWGFDGVEWPGPALKAIGLEPNSIHDKCELLQALAVEDRDAALRNMSAQNRPSPDLSIDSNLNSGICRQRIDWRQ